MISKRFVLIKRDYRTDQIPSFTCSNLVYAITVALYEAQVVEIVVS